MADNTLIQSGRDLYRSRGEQVDYAAAFAEGEQMITDQIDKNRQRKQAEEDRAQVLKDRERNNMLRDMELEEQLTEAAASKGEYFRVVQQLQDRGLIEIPNVALWNTDRDSWYKDESNRLKLAETAGDLEAVRTRLNNVINGEKNWDKIVNWSKGATISDSSPEAQQIDLAVEFMVQNGMKPKPITKDGRDYFQLTTATGEIIEIPVDRFGAEDGNIAGEYDTPASISGLMADFESQNPGISQLLEGRQLTPEIIEQMPIIREKMNLWLNNYLDTDVKIQEVANTLFQRTGFNPVDFAEQFPNAEIVTDQFGNQVLDTDKNTEGIQTEGAREIIKEMFQGMYGVQDQQPVKTAAEIKDELDIEKKKADIAHVRAKANEINQKLNLDQDAIQQRIEVYNRYLETGDLQDIIAFEGISSIKKNKDDVWIITYDDNTEFEAGSGDKPDEETLRNAIGVPQDAQVGDFDQYYT